MEAVPGREFGSIFCGSDNLARSVAAAGWAKVTPAGPPAACYFSSVMHVRVWHLVCMWHPTQSTASEPQVPHFC